MRHHPPPSQRTARGLAAQFGEAAAFLGAQHERISSPVRGAMSSWVGKESQSLVSPYAKQEARRPYGSAALRNSQLSASAREPTAPCSIHIPPGYTEVSERAESGMAGTHTPTYSRAISFRPRRFAGSLFAFHYWTFFTSTHWVGILIFEMRVGLGINSGQSLFIFGFAGYGYWGCI
ncbi:hypothetical protein K438DRAFT_2021972 [Mycena galopus ATCC 62051]|nr:hypothetical protein K438DRAFT_2021972 [Mycena galopus ATCC 62051]